MLCSSALSIALAACSRQPGRSLADRTGTLSPALLWPNRLCALYACGRRLTRDRLRNNDCGLPACLPGAAVGSPQSGEYCGQPPAWRGCVDYRCKLSVRNLDPPEHAYHASVAMRKSRNSNRGGAARHCPGTLSKAATGTRRALICRVDLDEIFQQIRTRAPLCHSNMVLSIDAQRRDTRVGEETLVT